MHCSSGGIGRHAGLKILWAEMSVRVRFPSRAHSSPCTVFFMHGFFCSRLLLCPASFVRGFFVRVLGSLCQQALPDDASWHPCAPRQRYCWPVRHGRGTAGRRADRQDCEQVSSSRSAIGKKLLALSLYELPSGKTYWQKRTKMPILCSESGDWH